MNLPSCNTCKWNGRLYFSVGNTRPCFRCHDRSEYMAVKEEPYVPNGQYVNIYKKEKKEC